MRRIWGAIAVVVAMAALFNLYPSQAAAQNVNNFEVASFDANYHLSRNQLKTSLLDVEEHIVVRFPNFDQNHGILRAIPKSYQGHTMSLDVSSIQNEDGRDWNYTTYDENDNLVLKIGDADKFVRGETTYVIKYSLRNVTLNFNDHDEFYWDVNGNEWPVPFEKVTATLTMTEDLAKAMTGQTACYAGMQGEANQENCDISASSSSVSANSELLNPYQTLTMVVGFTPGTFVPGPEIAAEQRRENILIGASILLAILPALISGFIMYKRWRKFGDDPKGRGVIVPEYQPPKKLDVLAADYIYKQDLRTQAISAQAIAWAISGHLVLHEIPKKGLFGKTDYQLTLNSVPSHLPEASKKVLQLFFGDELAPGTTQKISDLKKSHQSTIYNDFQKIAASQAEHLHTLGYFVKNPRAIKTSYRIWSVIPFIIGGGLLFVGIGTTVYVISALGAGFLLAGLVMVIFSYLMPARTQKGVELHDYMTGLQDYIKLAEKDRLSFGQSPEGAEKIKESGVDPGDPKMRVKLFESLLPFAILFGLEKKWAKQFEGIYKSAPDWYSGHQGAFTTAYLGSSLGDFGKSSSSSFSPPSSSSGSGFSGGGSSGGGGGGGGGGGW